MKKLIFVFLVLLTVSAKAQTNILNPIGHISLYQNFCEDKIVYGDTSEWQLFKIENIDNKIRYYYVRQIDYNYVNKCGFINCMRGDALMQYCIDSNLLSNNKNNWSLCCVEFIRPNNIGSLDTAHINIWKANSNRF